MYAKHNIYIINLIYCSINATSLLRKKITDSWLLRFHVLYVILHAVTYSKILWGWKKIVEWIMTNWKAKKTIKICWSTPFSYSPTYIHTHTVGADYIKLMCVFVYFMVQTFLLMHMMNMCAIRKRFLLFASAPTINIHFIILLPWHFVSL